MKLAVTALALFMAASASAADVAGKWKSSAPSPDGQMMELVFTFKVDGTALTGSVMGPMGEMPITEGMLDGDAISFTVDPGGFKIVHKGTVTGDTMKLKVDMGDQSFEMTATRVPPEKARQGAARVEESAPSSIIAPARPEEPTPDAPPAGAVRVGGAVPEPRKLKAPSPNYPPIARQGRVQGAVVLEVTISPEGKVVDLTPLRGPDELIEAAIEAVRQWEYTPTLVDGKPVPVILTVTVNFRIS
jgi:TonB family protein